MIPKVLYQFKDRAGAPFQPSNGTEGIMFCEKFCDQCLNCHPNPDKNPQCDILMLTMCFYPTDKEYPKEWIFNEEGWPVCTAWQKWDWGNDDDFREPPEPPCEPQDPGQLTIFTEKEFIGEYETPELIENR